MRIVLYKNFCSSPCFLIMGNCNVNMVLQCLTKTMDLDISLVTMVVNLS